MEEDASSDLPMLLPRKDLGSSPKGDSFTDGRELVLRDG
jgi:hypothetical protein